MATITHGPLVLDVPADWSDDTFILLTLPAPAPTAPMRVPQGETPRPTLMVRRIALQSDLPLEILVDGQEQSVRLTVDGAQLMERGELQIAGQRALMRDIVVGKMRQLHASVKVGRDFVMFVGSALDDVAFPREAFLRVMTSMRLTS